MTLLDRGIEFVQSGGRGTNTSLFLRGTESDHVLVLVDGVEVGSATTGTRAFEDIPLANVDRVEVVRGPRSSLYGWRAIGGVIQIFTRDGEGAHASVGAGSHRLRQAAAGYGHRSGGTRVGINFSAEEAAGIDARENNFVRNGEACGSPFISDCNEPGEDGYENRSVSASASHDLTDIDAETAEVASNLEYAEDTRDTAGVYAQHQWTRQAWNTEVSVRRESYDDFDDPVTGTVAAGYRFTPSMRAFASYGTAFRAPTFNELYYLGFGNPDLEPEESRTFETGLRGHRRAMRWQVTASTQVDQLIANVVGPGGGLEPQNVNEARITGIELTVGASTREWDRDASIDLKDTENVETGEELPRRAQIVLTGSLTRDLGAWSVGTDVTVRGDRFDDTANEVPLGTYGLVDLRAGGTSPGSGPRGSRWPTRRTRTTGWRTLTTRLAAHGSSSSRGGRVLRTEAMWSGAVGILSFALVSTPGQPDSDAAQPIRHVAKPSGGPIPEIGCPVASRLPVRYRLQSAGMGVPEYGPESRV